MSALQSITSRMKKLVVSRTLGIILLLFGALVGGGVISIIWVGTQGLPSFETLQEYQPSIVSRVYADNQQPIGQFYVERRIFTPLSDIPQDLLNAVIAVEDTRFFDHPGLDIVGIFRAAWTNLKRGGKFQGASTITQQLARSLFLSPERTYQRKIRELILAFKMELALTKEQILEMYLNQIYFGHGAYGVGSASLTYFDKRLSEVSLPEAAFLAGLPKAPSTYSPYRNPDLAKTRQEHVIGRMVQAGFINDDLAQQATETDLAFRRQAIDPIGSYFLEHVRQVLVEHYGETMVYKGGLQVHTTLNIAMQLAAEKALRTGLRQLDKRQGWRGPLRNLPLSDLDSDETESSKNDLEKLKGSDEILEAVVTQVSKDSAQVLVANTFKGSISLKDMKWARRQLQKGAEVTEAVVLENPQADNILKLGDVIEVGAKNGDWESGAYVLEQTPLVEGALIAIDPRNGAIRAMAGGYDFERSQFNRAVIARRQPRVSI